MNTYATTQQLVEHYGLDDMAELLADEERLLTPELLAAALAGALDPDDWSDVQIDAANAAMKRMNDALVGSSRLIDGYVAAQTALPLTDDQVAATPLRECCMALTCCDLMDDDDNYTERAEKGCTKWIFWLKDVAAGRVVLFPNAAGGTSGRVISGRSKTRYDWGNFGGGWGS